ncbi:hypothetical protein J1N35_045192 [Gossypium stocksii]|uniref:Uncharacterized protein n=1 Tax=Gossypium stocksii TaxID=47602 RepID=A0A9D3UAW1_9ROSI|nr:hypothetical protein J1N35_045192 [Gossypium stocksii]
MGYYYLNHARPYSGRGRNRDVQLFPLKLEPFNYQKKEDDSQKESSPESSYSSSYSSSSDEEPEEKFQRIAQTQPKVEVPLDDDPMMDETQQGESSSQAPRTTKGPFIGRMTFTLDDIPLEKWPARIQEFHS